MSVLVTIDGVSGVFKTWIAEDVAKHFGWQYLSCGMIYRAIAFYGYTMYKESILAHSDDIIKQIEDISIQCSSIGINHIQYNLSDLRRKEIGRLTTLFAKDIIVQNFIHKTIRKLVEGDNYIIEGREMASVFPEAKPHYYFYATPEARICRYIEKNNIVVGNAEFSELCANLRMRDEEDSKRRNNPLRIPDDAIVVDVGNFGFNHKQIFDYTVNTIIKQFNMSL